MKPFWITFYSYKGGVGRSLALANIAALLVKAGRNVVLIDFDLEAPGLDSFAEFGCIVGKPGVVEYATEFTKTGMAPDISQYVHPCDLGKPVRGKLWIMPAGTKNAHYNHDRVRIDWGELYEKGLGEPFFENWKAAIAHKCHPDYILVDSRTGLTDVGGICTLHLPDLVVMVFGLNEQNTTGIAAVANTIRESGFQRIPQIHYVASPVPNLPKETQGLLTRRLENAANKLGVKFESIIHYNASAALHETLFTLTDEATPTLLLRDYHDLLTKLIQYNRTGLDYLSTQVDEFIASGDPTRIVKLYDAIENDFAQTADGLFLMSKLKLAIGERPDAVSLARRAFETDPAHAESFAWLSIHYRNSTAFAEGIKLCDAALTQSKRMPLYRVGKIHYQRGCLALASSLPQIAVESFDICLKAAKNDDKAPFTILMHMFNLAEARRRADGAIDVRAWRDVVNQYESSAEGSDMPLPVQANCFQAIHIAFALTGKFERANSALAKANQAAGLLSGVEEVFTVKSYTDVSVEDFLRINTEMMRALDASHLWDGTPIPKKSDVNTQSVQESALAMSKGEK